jgi:hypothetical protein
MQASPTPFKSPVPKSWRDVLAIHPAAELLPRMSPDELKALGADIAKNGQRQPIAIIEKARPQPDGMLHVGDPTFQEVLDGISRLDAMEGAGIRVVGKDGLLDPRIQRIEVDTDEVDPVAFVISANFHRRHLTADQKRELIAKLIKAQPEKSNRQIARTAKADDKTVGSVRREMEGRAEIPHVLERTDTKGRQQPAHKPDHLKDAVERASKHTEETKQAAGDGVEPSGSSVVRQIEPAAKPRTLVDWCEWFSFGIADASKALSKPDRLALFEHLTQAIRDLCPSDPDPRDPGPIPACLDRRAAP